MREIFVVMDVGTMVGLGAVLIAGAGAVTRSLRVPRRVAGQHALGAHEGTVRGRMWVTLNPPVRVDLYEKGMVMTPSFLPRVTVLAADIDAIARVKDARASGRRKRPGTRIEFRQRHRIALELDDSAHQVVLDWWQGRAA